MLFQVLALASVLNVLHLVVSSFLQGLQRLRETAIIALKPNRTQNNVHFKTRQPKPKFLSAVDESAREFFKDGHGSMITKNT